MFNSFLRVHRDPGDGAGGTGNEEAKETPSEKAETAADVSKNTSELDALKAALATATETINTMATAEQTRKEKELEEQGKLGELVGEKNKEIEKISAENKRIVRESAIVVAVGETETAFNKSELAKAAKRIDRETEFKHETDTLIEMALAEFKKITGGVEPELETAAWNDAGGTNKDKRDTRNADIKQLVSAHKAAKADHSKMFGYQKLRKDLIAKGVDVAKVIREAA